MTAAAEKRGVILSGASRPLTPGDFDKFDLIVGMVRGRKGDRELEFLYVLLQNMVGSFVIGR